MNTQTNQPDYQPNYSNIVYSKIRKQYDRLSDKEASILSREIIFAPDTYEAILDDKPVKIRDIKENLADFIERDSGNKNFIPYSLEDDIADIIEKSKCGTTSITEYYRWINYVNNIAKDFGDGKITADDIAERDEFISMSYDREAEMLLCLSLYEGSKNPETKEKQSLLRFKIARLRELRSIVHNTMRVRNFKQEKDKDEKRAYCIYCQELLEKCDISSHNINLAPFIVGINYDDLDENYSNLEHTRSVALLLLRILEEKKLKTHSQENNITNNNIKETEVTCPKCHSHDNDYQF